MWRDRLRRIAAVVVALLAGWAVLSIVVGTYVLLLKRLWGPMPRRVDAALAVLAFVGAGAAGVRVHRWLAARARPPRNDPRR